MNGASSDYENPNPDAPGAEETIVRVRESLPPAVRGEVNTELRAYLEVTAGPGRGRRFYLTGPEHVIGRNPDVDIYLPDESISRSHARVILRNDGYLLQDMDSKNGTFLNDTRVHECPLHTGDEITVGNHALHFLYETIRIHTL